LFLKNMPLVFDLQIRDIQLINSLGNNIPIDPRYQKLSFHVGHHGRVHELHAPQHAAATPCVLMSAPNATQQPQSLVELHYETHNIKFLHHHKLVVLDAEGDAVVELPLYDLALLPQLHIHRLPHQDDVKLHFGVNME
jgi:hypothetical protein